MVTSARNAIEGKIVDIKSGAVNTEIALRSGDVLIVAIVTNESAKRMNLKKDEDVFALVKASSIILSKDADLEVSARNYIAAVVNEVIVGAVNTEVIMHIGKNSLVAVITNESAKALGVKSGDSLFAIFKASSVIIGKKRGKG